MKKLFLFSLVIFINITLYAQCDWSVVFYDDFEHNNVDPGYVQGTAYSNGTPDIYGAKNGEKGLYLNISEEINVGATVYDKTFNVCPGFTYKFTAWVCSRWGSQCDMDIDVVDEDGNVFYQFSGPVSFYDDGWMQVNTEEFTTNSSTIRFTIKTNLVNGWYGNDFAMDDILLEGCNRTIENFSPICPNYTLNINLFDSLTTNNTNGIWQETSLQNDYLGTFHLNTNDTGTYVYWIDNGICPDSTENVTVYYEDFNFEFPDTVMCQGQPINIFPPENINFFSPSDSTTSSSLTISNEDTFYVELNKSGCFTKDTFQVVEIAPPYVDLGQDIIACPDEEEVILQASTNGTAFKWSDGSTQPTLEITQTGEYHLTTSIEQCTSTDTINVTIVPDIKLGNDTTICEGDFFTIDLDKDYDDYSWHDGDKSTSKEIHYDGEYFVTVKKLDCIIQSDTLKVNRVLLPRILETTDDTLICENFPLLLKVKAELYDNLLWHDSHTDTVTIVRESGIYWVSASNTCGVETDSIKVTTENCLCQEFLPNVFTPNNDRLNDFFGYQSNCIPSKYYSLQIFNRWGEQLFESRDYNEKWDGTHKGSLCPTGVYSYLLIVQYKNDLGKRTIKRKFSLNQ